MLNLSSNAVHSVNISNVIIKLLLILYLQKGLLSPVPAVSAAMKEKYLDWSYKTGSYKRARKTFTRYTSNVL